MSLYGETEAKPQHIFGNIYVIQKGDSFWSISKKYGCSATELARMNNKTIFSTLHSDDILKVPEKTK